jgi:hypothetical protein
VGWRSRGFYVTASVSTYRAAAFSLSADGGGWVDDLRNGHFSVLGNVLHTARTHMQFKRNVSMDKWFRIRIAPAAVEACYLPLLLPWQHGSGVAKPKETTRPCLAGRCFCGSWKPLL